MLADDLHGGFRVTGGHDLHLVLRVGQRPDTGGSLRLLHTPFSAKGDAQRLRLVPSIGLQVQVGVSHTHVQLAIPRRLRHDEARAVDPPVRGEPVRDRLQHELGPDAGRVTADLALEAEQERRAGCRQEPERQVE